MKTTAKLWIGIGILILLSPIGLLLPELFRAGAAWGEWGTEEIKELVGYVPSGMQRLAELWKAPLPDYALRGWEKKGLAQLSLAYIICAAVGVAIIVSATLLIGRLLANRGVKGR